MTTSELVDLLKEAWGGDPWHGPSLQAVLARADAARAAARPLGRAHTAFEIVRHLTAWTREVERRLGGALAGEPLEGDWPPVGDTSDDGWNAAIAELSAAHRSLVDAVARQPDARWQERVGDLRDPAAGTGVSYGVMIVGLATHHAYHAGQIAILVA